MSGARQHGPGSFRRNRRAAAGGWAAVLVLAMAALRGAEPGEVAPDDTGISIARLSLHLKSFAVNSEKDFEHALEHTQAHEESVERMAAVLAGEKALFTAAKLSGQAKLDFLEQAARAGDAAAAAAVGEKLDLGDGPKEDAARAFAYARAGAIGGRMEAAHNTGAAYATGRGVKRDFTEALAWLIVARTRGDTSGADEQLRRHLLDRRREDAIAAAEKRARELAVKGSREAVIAALPATAPLEFIADAAPSDEILNPGERDLAAARERRKAADAAPAEPELVVMTILGDRLVWPSLAALQQAANRGEPAAMGALGRLLASGKGLPEDPLRAAVLLERSAALGNVDAAHQLGDLYSDGAKLVRDDAKAFLYFMQAAHGGSTLAMASVGVCFTNGRGTEKDYAQGLAWLAVAKHYRIDLGQESRLRTFLAQHRPGDVAKADELAAGWVREIDAVREKLK